MKSLLITIASVALAAAMVGAAGDTAQDAERQLRAAMNTELIDGNLKLAIEQYKKVADSGNRALAAQALLRMADCYQKLGDREAQTIYERLVRDYGDQKPAAAAALARLGTKGATAAARGDRAVWSGREADLFGTVSPDGRFLSYVDWYGVTNVMVRDLVAGTSRAFTPNATMGQFGYGGWSAISRDGKQLVYEWERLDRIRELRIASLRGSGIPPSRAIRTFEHASVRPFDWSPDGKFLAVLVEEIGGGASQIGILSIQDGALRTLKSIDWRGVNKIVYSPDGRFIAYDLIADPPDRTQIHVMAVDATRESTVVADASANSLMGWSRDGDLVFASDRTGQKSLWTLHVTDGRAQDAPRLVKDNIGSTWSLGLTSTGTLFVWRASATYVKVAAIDPQSGKLLESGRDTFSQFVDSRGRPAWSADGQHLTYIACGASGGGPCALFIRSNQTGVPRRIPHPLRYLAFPRPSPDGKAIVANGTDLKGRRGIFLIDAQTGTTSLIAGADQQIRSRDPEWSPDGRAIRYREEGERDVIVWEKTVGGVEPPKELFRTLAAHTSAIRVSPDGRFAGFVREAPATKSSTFVVVPMSGGPGRVLFSAAGTFALSGIHWQWAADSQNVFLQKGNGAEMPIEIWRLPLTGQPLKLDMDASRWDEGFAVHPDGRQIAFAAFAGSPGAEVWALENFLPAQTSAKPTAKR